MTTGKYAGDIPGDYSLQGWAAQGWSPGKLAHSTSSEAPAGHLSYRLNSLKGGYIGGSIGDYYRVD